MQESYGGNRKHVTQQTITSALCTHSSIKLLSESSLSTSLFFVEGVVVLLCSFRHINTLGDSEADLEREGER